MQQFSPHPENREPSHIGLPARARLFESPFNRICGSLYPAARILRAPRRRCAYILIASGTWERREITGLARVPTPRDAQLGCAHEEPSFQMSVDAAPQSRQLRQRFEGCPAVSPKDRIGHLLIVSGAFLIKDLRVFPTVISPAAFDPRAGPGPLVGPGNTPSRQGHKGQYGSGFEGVTQPTDPCASVVFRRDCAIFRS
jgi:hypothetical protein